MNLLKNVLSIASFFFTTCMLCNNSFGALNTAGTSFMDLESSVKELRSLIDKNSPAVVHIEVYDDTGALRNSGSGFFIDREGRIITNASIWKDAYSAEVVSDNNAYSEVVVLDHNEELDIALIKVRATNEIPLELDFNYKASLGERVIIIGKLNGQVNTVSEGIISSFPKTEEKLKLIEIQTVVSILPNQGSKDGPVLANDGKVVGVASSTIFDKEVPAEIWRGFNNDQMFAVTLQSIKPLLSESGHIEHLHHAKSKIWFRWFASSLKSMILTGVLFFYDIGLNKLMVLLFVIVVIGYMLGLLYSKYIRPGKNG